ncbi:MAG: thioredoxin family protein, partial [Proteobacteria bacterium]|nr:thioredoxin family protein [Pseudomonadota bacterium]
MALALAGCSGSDDVEAPVGAANTATDSSAQIAANKIQWFKGSTAEAFAKARKEGKPLFLFWGTDWCPDCSQVKATIFSGREFIAKSRLFVPVYLDGDTENAQRTGEEFGVKGYPTMMVFSPQGDEITRIPGGIGSKRYNNVLDLALNDIQPVARLVERVTGGGPALN